MALTDKQKQALGAGAIATILAAAGAAAKLAAPFEGERLTPYNDPVGIRTVCYGETHNVEERRYTHEECELMLNSRMLESTEQVYLCHPGLPFGPLVAASDFVYNVRNGLKIVCTGSIGKLFKKQDFKGACLKITEYDKAGKKRLPGLTKRRKADFDACMRGL